MNTAEMPAVQDALGPDRLMVVQPDSSQPAAPTAPSGYLVDDDPDPTVATVASATPIGHVPHVRPEGRTVERTPEPPGRATARFLAGVHRRRRGQAAPEPVPNRPAPSAPPSAFPRAPMVMPPRHPDVPAHPTPVTPEPEAPAGVYDEQLHAYVTWLRTYGPHIGILAVQRPDLSDEFILRLVHDYRRLTLGAVA